MPIDFSLPIDELASLGISLLCGAILGLEREYRNKSAGLRTMILICMGATVFAIVSHHGSGSDDRIAANIITGIGFIGGGVIFKDKMAMLGLTTASVIWVAAAIGMTAGFGAHSTALVFTTVVVCVLLSFGKLEEWVNGLPQNLAMTITLEEGTVDHLASLSALASRLRLKSKRTGITKGDSAITVRMQVAGRAKDIAAFQYELLQMPEVKAFH